ncbi:MAG: calcium/sodium antiporter [Gammaproteobacteria bacterium]
MVLALSAIVGGLILLLWSADRFVEGAAAAARHLGMPPLLIGMVVVGFGTSAPELTVAALAALQGNPGIVLGNAYGSNITNIALILGLTAVLNPVTMHSQVLRRELPILLAVTVLAGLQLIDETISRFDAAVLLGVFALLMGWSIRDGVQKRRDTLADEIERELREHAMPLINALFWLVVGLVMLIVSSRMLIWGAVKIARHLGISDLIIGLTVVAIGTSLPELASSVIAARKGEHDIVLGNILGSNLFNTLAAVGIAGIIQPMRVAPEVLYRDWMLMTLLTASLFVAGYGFSGTAGRIDRTEGQGLVGIYIMYTLWLIYTAMSG